MDQNIEDLKKEALKKIVILKADLQTALDKKDIQTANKILVEIKSIYKSISKELNCEFLKPNISDDKNVPSM